MFQSTLFLCYSGITPKLILHGSIYYNKFNTNFPDKNHKHFESVNLFFKWQPVSLHTDEGLHTHTQTLTN
jgi:hypothetical protein